MPIAQIIAAGDPRMPPPDIIEAAEKVGRYFDMLGARQWVLGPCQSRYSPTPCPIPSPSIAELALALQVVHAEANAVAAGRSIKRLLEAVDAFATATAQAATACYVKLGL